MTQTEKNNNLIKNSSSFTEWYQNKLQTQYPPILDLDEIQGLVNKIVAWYELKYPNEENTQTKPSTYYTFDKLKAILTPKEIEALECNYRWNCLYHSEPTGEHYICLYLPQINAPTNKAVIYANRFGLVDPHHIQGLDQVIPKKKTMTLQKIYNKLQNSPLNNFDISELENCINMNKTDIELRNEIILFSILTLIYREDIYIEKSYYRAKCLLEEFNDYYLLNIEIEKMLAQMSKLPVIKRQYAIPVEEPYPNNQNHSIRFLEKLKIFFNPPKEEQLDLKVLYQNYLNDFHQTGIKPYPDRLLALLLLPEKEKYEPLLVSEGQFYKIYKQEIDEKIKQVITDFQLTKEDIVHFIEAKGFFSCEENYEHDKIWHVFSEGFGVMHGSLMYRPEDSPEKVYQDSLGCFYEEKSKEDIQLKKKSKQKDKN